MTLRICLLGDPIPGSRSVQAILLALERAALKHRVKVDPVWIGSMSLKCPEWYLSGFAGIWCIPGRAPTSECRLLRAIRFARECHIPFLSTGNGSHHALTEFLHFTRAFRNRMGADMIPPISKPLMVPGCLPEREPQTSLLHINSPTLRHIYRKRMIVENDPASYTVNRATESALFKGEPYLTGHNKLIAEKYSIKAAARDGDGRVRAFEVLGMGRPLFLGTFYQSEATALDGNLPPIVSGFVRAIKQIEQTRPWGRAELYRTDDEWCRIGSTPVRIGVAWSSSGLNGAVPVSAHIAKTDSDGLKIALSRALQGRDITDEISFEQFQKREPLGTTTTTSSRAPKAGKVVVPRYRVEIVGLRDRVWLRQFTCTTMGVYSSNVDWEESIEMSKSRDRILTRAVSILQKRF